MSEITEQGRKALVKVAEWLEAGAPHVTLANGLRVDHFAMDSVVQVEPDCGTSCCIAGAVCQFEGLGLDVRMEGGELAWMGEKGGFELAFNFLGMGYDEACELFEPWNNFSGDDEDFNSAARGAAVIRHYLDTGEVDWDRFNDDGELYEG